MEKHSSLGKKQSRQADYTTYSWELSDVKEKGNYLSREIQDENVRSVGLYLRISKE